MIDFFVMRFAIAISIFCLFIYPNHQIRGDVVVSNFNTTGQALTGTGGSGKKFNVLFTVGSGQTVKLGAIAVFSSINSTESNLDFTLTNGTVTYTDSNLVATTTANTFSGFSATYMTYFNFSTAASTNIGFNNLTAGSWTLTVGGNGSNGLNQSYFYTSDATNSFLNPPLTAGSETAYTAGRYINYAIDTQGIAVPEPGTLLLGSIVAASGGAGVWWKRRKKKAAEQSEAPEGTPAV